MEELKPYRFIGHENLTFAHLIDSEKISDSR